MNSGSAGGALLKHPDGLAERLNLLRECGDQSFSVKVRSGYDDPEQIFGLLPIFEKCGVDFVLVYQVRAYFFFFDAGNRVKTIVLRRGYSLQKIL